MVRVHLGLLETKVKKILNIGERMSGGLIKPIFDELDIGSRFMFGYRTVPVDPTFKKINNNQKNNAINLNTKEKVSVDPVQLIRIVK